MNTVRVYISVSVHGLYTGVTRLSTRPVHSRLRAVYTCTRSLYTAVYNPCTRSCSHVHGPCSRPYNGRRPIRAVNYGREHLYTVPVHSRVYSLYVAVYGPCTLDTTCTRPCTGRVHGRAHGLYIYKAVYTGRVRTRQCTRPCTMYTAVYPRRVPCTRPCTMYTAVRVPCTRPCRRAHGPYTAVFPYTVLLRPCTRPSTCRQHGRVHGGVTAV